MNFAVAILVGIWAFGTFTVAAAGGLFRSRRSDGQLPETRHPRTRIADEPA